MSDTTITLEFIARQLREIQSELADMRDDRTIMIAMLNRHDGGITSLATEMRALRSQFDRFRNETREQLNDTRERLQRIESAITGGSVERP